MYAKYKQPMKLEITMNKLEMNNTEKQKHLTSNISFQKRQNFSPFHTAHIITVTAGLHFHYSTQISA